MAAVLDPIAKPAAVRHRLRDEEPQGIAAHSLFTHAEARAIEGAVVALAAAERAVTEIDAAVIDAKNLARMEPATTGPSASREAAMAWLAKKPLPEPRKPVDDMQPTMNARRVLGELTTIATERSEAQQRARGALRTAIASAMQAARMRACARVTTLCEELTEASAEAFALDTKLGIWIDNGKLDTSGMLRNQSLVLAPPPEMRPKSARVENLHFREVAFAPTSNLHNAIELRVGVAVENQLRKSIGDRVRWPF